MPLTDAGRRIMAEGLHLGKVSVLPAGGASAPPPFVLTTPIAEPRQRFRELMLERAGRFGQDPAYTLLACPLCEFEVSHGSDWCALCDAPLVKLSVGVYGDAKKLMERIRSMVREHGQTTWTPLAKLIVQACVEDYFYRPKPPLKTGVIRPEEFKLPNFTWDGSPVRLGENGSLNVRFPASCEGPAAESF